MKYVKYFMALAAACILIMPAFSMPEDSGSQTCGQMAEDKHIGSGQVAGQMEQCGRQMCQGQNPVMDAKEKDRICPQCNKPMMYQDGQDQQMCQCQGYMMPQGGQDRQTCQQCNKPMMYQDGQDHQICQCQCQDSMRDSKMNARDSWKDSKFNGKVYPQCNRHLMPQEVRNQQTCQCQKGPNR